MRNFLNPFVLSKNMGPHCEMKGYLSFMVLRLISKGYACGEEIAKELEKRKGSRPSPGTIYPVLKSLHENKFIEEIECTGKEKKYKITSLGKKELDIATKQFVRMFFDMKSEF
jgi:PadR family transcriptional regulator, regulatory protein PadR